MVGPSSSGTRGGGGGGYVPGVREMAAGPDPILQSLNDLLERNADLVSDMIPLILFLCSCGADNRDTGG
jgi:hypothetical protein